MKAQKYISKPVDNKGFVDWSETETEIWKKLFLRQKDIIKGRACNQFIEGLDVLGYNEESIPQIPKINEVLEKITGWGVEPVPAVIQPSEFFTLLANKRFPAATFIRTPEDLNYIQEPDIFHEIYGHTPLLVHQAYGDFLEKFGKLALAAEPKYRRKLFNIFWFSIEFGLTETADGLRAYGGGILSSIGETQYCLGPEPERVAFDALEVVRTPYRIDIMQPKYFVIDKFEDLFTILDQDILPIIDEAKKLGDRDPLYPPKPVEENNDDVGAMKC